jgi:hypothetical protein
MDAGVAQAIGGGLGNFGKAMMQGRALAEKARQEALLKEALMGRYEAQSQKDIQEAQIAQERLAMMKNPLPNAAMQFGVPSALLPALSDRIETGQWGAAHQPLPEDVAGPTLPSLDDRTVRNIMRNMSAYQRMIATDSKVDQGEKAISEMQKRDYVDDVVADPKLAANVGQAYAATEGKPLWNATGTTGYSTNNFTGDGMASNPRLTQLFGLESGSRTSENLAQANSANSTADLNRAKLQQLGSEPLVIQNADGTTTIVSRSKEPKPMTESQAKAAVFGPRMFESEKLMTELEESGVTSSGYVKNFIGGAIGIVSDDAANAADSVLRVGTSSDQKRLDQAQRDFLNAVLRRESGAVITPTEFANGSRQYFPQVGDDEAVIAQKRANRRLATQQILAEIPRAHAYTPRGGGAMPTAAAPQGFGGAPAIAQSYSAGTPLSTRESDRDAILRGELREANARLQSAMASGDQAVINRALADVASINRELGIKTPASAQAAPAQPTTWGREIRGAPMTPQSGANSGGFSIRRLD